MYRASLVGDSERIVAGWVLEERLGSGGFGEVWRARRRHLDLRRALKLIPIHSEMAFESWRHEIGRLEDLSHPNVVRFYDADIVTEGPYSDYAWIATELCERSLADELSRRDRPLLSPLECVRLVDEMLAALAAARTAGCVHRDVKPANILRHATGAWKLADFGTARLVPTGATHPVTQVIGTLPYMSPAAHHGHQNHAADLYALGVIVQESLCGQRLHPRADRMTDSEYLKFVLDNAPVVATGLPPRWQTLVEALIGRHGELDAEVLAAWFAKTRGLTPPQPSDGAGASSTGPTSIESKAPRIAPPTTDATGPTQLRSDPSPVRRTNAVRSPSPGRVLVPAPPQAPAPAKAPPAAPRPIPASYRPPGPAPGPAPVSGPAPGPAPGLGAAWGPAPLSPTAVLGRRMGAGLLDAVLLLVALWMLAWAAIVATHDRIAVDDGVSPSDACRELEESVVACEPFIDSVYVTDSRLEGEVSVGALALVLVGHVVFEGLTGRTLGKLIFGIRVVGPTGRRPGVGRSFRRTALWVVDGFPYFVPLLGLLVAVSSKDRRRVGDRVAGTFVIRSR